MKNRLAKSILIFPSVTFPSNIYHSHLVNLLFPPGEESLETETALPPSHGFLGEISTAGVGGNETPLANLPGEKGPPAGEASSMSSLSSSSSSSPMLEMSRRLAWLGFASAFLNSSSSSMVVITTCSISCASCSSVLILHPWALRAARRSAGEREPGEEDAGERLFSCLKSSSRLPLTVRASLLEQVSSSQPCRQGQAAKACTTAFTKQWLPEFTWNLL